MITITTIEGALINKNSLFLFNKWLIYEFLENVNICNSNNIESRLSTVKRRLANGDNIFLVINSLFSSPFKKISLSYNNLKYTKKLKHECLKILKSELNLVCNSEEELLILYRLLFKGKTDTLISLENNNCKHIDEDFRKFIKLLKEVYLLRFSYLFGKTSGWVTRFLNFSIEFIELNYNENDFNSEFKKIFPELYDIIEIASSSIE